MKNQINQSTRKNEPMIERVTIIRVSPAFMTVPTAFLILEHTLAMTTIVKGCVVSALSDSTSLFKVMSSPAAQIILSMMAIETGIINALISSTFSIEAPQLE